MKRAQRRIHDRGGGRVREDALGSIPARPGSASYHGRRYAILLCGAPSARHLNDMEFCYRMLRQRHRFDDANIFVMHHDGTLSTVEGPAPELWPGNNTPYTMRVTHPGSIAAFQSVLQGLANPDTGLKADDLLFIHTNGHGDGISSVAYLRAFPGELYMAPQFARDLAALPRYRALLVMMQQCCSGGFNRPIVDASTARHTSVASAARARSESHASRDDPQWNAFARAWIAAQMGRDIDDKPLRGEVRARVDGLVDAAEAYRYAARCVRKLDTPSRLSSRTGAGITLGHSFDAVRIRPRDRRFGPLRHRIRHSMA
jgi:hypothetical protein